MRFFKPEIHITENRFFFFTFTNMLKYNRQIMSNVFKTEPVVSKPLIILSLFIPVFQTAHNSLTNSNLVSSCSMAYLDMHLWRCLSHSLFSGPKHATSNGCSTSVTCGGNLSMIIFCSNAFLITGADM